MGQDVWLSERQQQVWRSWLDVGVRLPAAMQADMQRDAGLSLSEVGVLVWLSESPEARLRIADLAQGLRWERSRLSHQVTRMERRGLVRREQCPQDRRGAFVSLAAPGREALDRAAPGHARTVRSAVFDHLTDEELQTLGSVLDAILSRLPTQPV